MTKRYVFAENAQKKYKLMLQDKYNKEIRARLKEELKLSNVMAVPKVTKVTINVGAKEALTDKKNLDIIAEQLTQISGQKPVITKAKKSIATFKLREGDSVGVMVTLRGKRMYAFLEKLVGVAFPRIRDFRGLKLTAFDGKGNYSVGFKEQLVFPEIDAGKVDRVRPLQVVISTSARNDTEGLALLKAFGFPFMKV